MVWGASFGTNSVACCFANSGTELHRLQRRLRPHQWRRIPRRLRYDCGTNSGDRDTIVHVGLGADRAHPMLTTIAAGTDFIVGAGESSLQVFSTGTGAVALNVAVAQTPETASIPELWTHSL